MPTENSNEVLHELIGLIREVKDETKCTLKDVQNDLKSLSKEIGAVKIELAVLKAKAALWGAAASIVVSATISGLVRVMAGYFGG